MPRSSNSRLLCLTDVAPGYGSPQLQHLTASLADKLGGADVRLLSPDEKNRPSRELIYDGFETTRVATFLPPHDKAFSIEFNRYIVDVIREWKPSMIIAANGWVLPSVLRCADQPFSLIYYMLESLSHQKHGIGDWTVPFNCDAFRRADIVVTPERRRLNNDIEILNVQPKRSVELLNVGARDDREAVPHDMRERAVIAAGSIGPESLSQYLLALSHDIPVTLAGPTNTPASIALLEELQRARHIAFHGLLPASTVFDMRANHAYSLVMWAPSDINQIYAAPNKFFESIAAGTPPICAPHPQCREIIERYDCGLIMSDWSQKAFLYSVGEAMDIFDKSPERYAELVENCKRATREELNWESQMEKFSKAWP